MSAITKYMSGVLLVLISCSAFAGVSPGSACDPFLGNSNDTIKHTGLLRASSWAPSPLYVTCPIARNGIDTEKFSRIRIIIDDSTNQDTSCTAFALDINSNATYSITRNTSGTGRRVLSFYNMYIPSGGSAVITCNLAPSHAVLNYSYEYE
jgi:hypothetical protein